MVSEVSILPPTEGHWRFLGGGGVLKAKLLEKSMKLYGNFWGGEGVQNKKLSVGGTWIFSGTTQCYSMIGAFAVFNEPHLGDFVQGVANGLAKNTGLTKF